MRKVLTLVFIPIVVLAFATIILLPPAPLPSPERGVTLHSVMLVVPGESRHGPVDLKVEGQRITVIRPVDDQKITGYVLPGLANAHMHGPLLPLPGQNQLYAFLHLYHGVTLARMAAGDTAMRDAIADGLYPGPRIASCGPFLDGENPQWGDSLIVTDLRSAELAVQKVAEEGFDCIKVYNELTANASLAIYQFAQRQQLPVVGHVPWRQEFTRAWIDDRQHLVGWASSSNAHSSTSATHRLLELETLNNERIQQLIEASLEGSISLTPTLITLQRKFALQNYELLRDSTAAMLMPRFYRNLIWHGTSGLVSSRLLSDSEHKRFRKLYPKAADAVKQLYDSGVELHSGTDSPAEFIVPGAGLLEELQLLVDAGLSAEQALQISAVTTARYIGGGDYGQLRVGAPANFVVYSKDPTLNLQNLATRQAVILDGKYFDRQQLDEQLDRYRDWFNSAAYQFITELPIGVGFFMMNTLAP